MIDEVKQLRAFIKFKINGLSGNKNESAVKATLAKLRRGIGKAPGSNPELWEATLEGIPEALIGKNGGPSYGEWAVHTALTLYATHQQGKDPNKQCMSEAGKYLGSSVEALLSLIK
jgi:CRISPR system Cascade subunit CasB